VALQSSPGSALHKGQARLRGLVGSTSGIDGLGFAMHSRVAHTKDTGNAVRSRQSRKGEVSMALKITVGEIHRQHGSTPPVATHFYHPWMKKIYGIDLKPHFEQVFAREGTLRREANKRKHSRTFRVPFHGEEWRWESK
jgi:hypothetical protein